MVLTGVDAPQQGEELTFALFQATVIVEIDGRRWRSAANTSRYSPDYLAFTLTDPEAVAGILEALASTQSDILAGVDIGLAGQSTGNGTADIPADDAANALQQLAARCGPRTAADNDAIVKLLNQRDFQGGLRADSVAVIETFTARHIAIAAPAHIDGWPT